MKDVVSFSLLSAESNNIDRMSNSKKKRFYFYLFLMKEKLMMDSDLAVFDPFKRNLYHFFFKFNMDTLDE